MKKKEGRKSRDTVPLSFTFAFAFLLFNLTLTYPTREEFLNMMLKIKLVPVNVIPVNWYRTGTCRLIVGIRDGAHLFASAPNLKSRGTGVFLCAVSWRRRCHFGC
jgi:hypothetical protein